MSSLEISGLTDTGRAREHNEDCIGFDRLNGIAVLADGMGGHQAGEVASRMAVDDLLYSLRQLQSNDGHQDRTASEMLEQVCNAIVRCNRKIFDAAEADSGQRGMGTTIIAAVLQGDHLYAGHVGDSRLYLLRDDRLKRITRDHSLIQDLIDKGFYTETEARSAAIGHVVTRALGTMSEVEVDLIQQRTRHDDLFLICSDGLTDMLDDQQIGMVLRQNLADLESGARKLIHLANLQGGRDNISVMLLRVQSLPSTALQAPSSSVFHSTN